MRSSSCSPFTRFWPRLAQTGLQHGVAQQAAQRGGQLVNRPGLDEQAVLAVGDQPRDAGDPGGDDRDVQRHRLEQDVGQPLAEAAQGEDVHRLVQGRGVAR